MGRRGAPPSDIEITVHSSPNHPNAQPNNKPRRTAADAAAADAAAAARRREEEKEFRPFRRWAPFLVPVFIVANVALFVISMYVNDCPQNASLPGSCVGTKYFGRFSFQPRKENPLFGPSAATLLKMGALEVTKVVIDHEVWRLISCIWLHAGLIHIVANMLSLLFIGIRLEQEFGFLRIGPLYIISGFGGSLLSALFIESTISVGASGALFGLLGAMLSELITNWTIYANKLAALLTLVFIIAINLAVGFLPHVDNFAHIGGFVSGFLIGFVLLIRPQFGWVNQKNAPLGYTTGSAKPKYKIYQYVLWVISVVSLILFFTVCLVMLFRGVNPYKNCSWCHYLSCVPTSSWSCKPKSTSCMSSQSRRILNLTCSGTGKTQSYMLSNVTDAEMYDLCAQLCT